MLKIINKKAFKVNCKGTKNMNQNAEKSAKFSATAATFVNDNEWDETELSAYQGVKNYFFGKISERAQWMFRKFKWLTVSHPNRKSEK